MANNGVQVIRDLFTNSKHTRWIAPLLILFEAVLCGLIIWKVPYTEIDYSTYMQQVSQILKGERNYAKISGASGPLVYPAVHVYIYTILHHLTTIKQPNWWQPEKQDVLVDIGTAQIIFAGLYLVTLAVVIACHRRVDAPPWVLIPLVLSKRLHSIFLLRLFNDAWATFAFWLAIYAFQRREWSIATVIWSLGVGIKMSLLLAGPAVGFILIQGEGMAAIVSPGMLSILLQVLIAFPFLGPNSAEYFSRAFDFKRQFLFEWTVNWRFVGEDFFLSKEFAINLLIAHILTLALFAQLKWVKPSSDNLWDFLTKFLLGVGRQQQTRFSRNVTATFVMDAMLGSMVVGLLFARSLHYQFYAYLGWATPYLLWRAGFGPVFVLANCAIQELCWLTFPSTKWSSALVVAQLGLQVVCALIAPWTDHIPPPVKAGGRSKTE